MRIRKICDSDRGIELSSSRCWFFAVYPGRQSMLFLGTCRIVPHTTLHNEVVHVDLGFTLHAHLPASRHSPWLMFTKPKHMLWVCVNQTGEEVSGVGHTNTSH